MQKDVLGNVVDVRLANRNVRPTPQNPMHSAIASVNGITFIVHMDQFGTIRGASAPPRNVVK